MDAKLIQSLTDAAEVGAWHNALAIAHGLADPESLDDLVNAPLLALRLARVSFHAGFALNQELIRVYGSSFSAANLTPATFPERFSSRVFTLGIARAKTALEGDHWPQVLAMIHLGTQLPSLNPEHGSRLLSFLGNALVRVKRAQQEAIDRGVIFAGESDRPPTCFNYMPQMFRILARSEYFPDLSERFLRALLSFSDYPVLMQFDRYFISAAWAELLSIFRDRNFSKHLSEGSADWLCRAMVIDPAPHESDEFESNDDP